MMKNNFQRGVKLYLPAPGAESVTEFRRLISIAARFGYNFVMLELGGAMEYLSHPEINAGWLEYSAFMNEYPGKAKEIQEGFGWAKNSIHTDNGGGKVLSREALRELIGICREAGMEIVPEMPSLSHCDYLLTRHPELAERREDPYPDTCCPNHPDYFPLLCDLLDEVIELFHPRRINIGHDEFYSIALCPRCKGADPAALYAADVNRTAEFLKSRSVETVMWGEKLLDAHFTDGTPCGGADRPATGTRAHIPATSHSIEMISKEVKIFHWYWSIDRKLEESYADHGFDYLFGNFSASQLPELGRRLDAEHCLGYCVSNWGVTSFRTLQRNGILYDLVYAALATDGKHDPDDFETLHAETLRNLYELDRPEGEFLECVHTTSTPVKFEYFFDGYYLKEELFRMGDHIAADEEGKLYRFPVIFGTNISNSTVDPERRENPALRMDRFAVDHQFQEATCGTLPERGGDGRIFFRCRYPHPAPGKHLRYVRFEPASVFIPPVEVAYFNGELS